MIKKDFYSKFFVSDTKKTTLHFEIQGEVK